MSKVHYFQQYNQKENVVTNNTLLLFSRLSSISPARFEDFLNSLLQSEANAVNIGVRFSQQEGNNTKSSTPDGMIYQSSLKLLIETKLYDNQDMDQLIRHLDGFDKNEDNQILMLINPSETTLEFDCSIKAKVIEVNLKTNQNIRYISITFDSIIKALDSVLFEYDFELQDLLSDYQDFCISSDLIPQHHFKMRAIVSGMSFDENIAHGIYYAPMSRNYSKHGYIGLYRDKSIRAIGKLTKVVQADYDFQKNKFIKLISIEGNSLTKEEESKLVQIMDSAKNTNGWDIYFDHQFFFVDQFHKTDYKKVTKYPIQRTKFFNLDEVLNCKELPNTKEIADELNSLSWE